MYFWKYWRDTRTQFIGSLIVLPALCILFTVVAVKATGPDAILKGAPSFAHAWSTTTEIVVGGWASIFTLIWGLLLGAASLGEEFKEKTMDFLLVRPRDRSYWAWMGWLAGVCELSVMVVLAVATTFATLIYLTGRVQTWLLLATILPLALGGAVAYGVTYFMALLARNGRQGQSYGIGLLVIDLLLPAAVYYYWHVSFPSVLGFMMSACKWCGSGPGAFPAGSLVLWIAVALAFPFAAQLLLERAEV